MADKPIREQSALELLETHAQALEQENARLTRELEIQKQAQNAITNGLCARNERLRAALAGSVEVIKTWHNMSRIGLRGDPTLEAVWDIYWRCAPEMKPIREALAGVETSQLHKCAHPVLIDSQEQPGVDVYVCARCDAVVDLLKYRVRSPEETGAAPVVNAAGTGAYDVPQFIETNEDGSPLKATGEQT